MKNALLIVLCVLSLVTRARGHADRAGSVITPSRLDEVIARRMLRVCTTNPGLCSVHPDKPLVYGEKAFMVPRGDVTFQQYVNQFLHLSKANGDYQAVIDKWLK